MNFLQLFNNIKADLNKLQKLVLVDLSNYFSDQNITVLERKVQYGLGLRGAYFNKQVMQLELKLQLGDIIIEFYLNYDQLEYYIIDKKGDILKECNLEDSCSPKETIDFFLKYFKRDISSI